MPVYRGCMESERDYMRRRAAQEQAAADGASNEKARSSHNELAERYRHAARTRHKPSPTEGPERMHGLPLGFQIID